GADMAGLSTGCQAAGATPSVPGRVSESRRGPALREDLEDPGQSERLPGGPSRRSPRPPLDGAPSAETAWRAPRRPPWPRAPGRPRGADQERGGEAVAP